VSRAPSRERWRPTSPNARLTHGSHERPRPRKTARSTLARLPDRAYIHSARIRRGRLGRALLVESRSGMPPKSMRSVFSPSRSDHLCKKSARRLGVESRIVSVDQHAATASPTVSVILPTFQRRELVRRSVASALAQTVREIEVIVVDDGSTDGTEEILSGPDERLKYFAQAHRGVAAARNLGIRYARAPIVAFLDADEIWLPEHLAVSRMRLHSTRTRYWPQCVPTRESWAEGAVPSPFSSTCSRSCSSRTRLERSPR